MVVSDCKGLYLGSRYTVQTLTGSFSQIAACLGAIVGITSPAMAIAAEVLLLCCPACGSSGQERGLGCDESSLGDCS